MSSCATAEVGTVSVPLNARPPPDRGPINVDMKVDLGAGEHARVALSRRMALSGKPSRGADMGTGRDVLSRSRPPTNHPIFGDHKTWCLSSTNGRPTWQSSRVGSHCFANIDGSERRASHWGRPEARRTSFDNLRPRLALFPCRGSFQNIIVSTSYLTPASVAMTRRVRIGESRDSLLPPSPLTDGGDRRYTRYAPPPSG